MTRLLLLLIAVIVNTCRHSATGTTEGDTRGDVIGSIIEDISDSICNLNFLQQAFLYLDFCKYDGFDACSKF